VIRSEKFVDEGLSYGSSADTKIFVSTYLETVVRWKQL